MNEGDSFVQHTPKGRDVLGIDPVEQGSPSQRSPSSTECLQSTLSDDNATLSRDGKYQRSSKQLSFNRGRGRGNQHQPNRGRRKKPNFNQKWHFEIQALLRHSFGLLLFNQNNDPKMRKPQEQMTAKDCLFLLGSKAPVNASCTDGYSTPKPKHTAKSPSTKIAPHLKLRTGPHTIGKWDPMRRTGSTWVSTRLGLCEKNYIGLKKPKSGLKSQLVGTKLWITWIKLSIFCKSQCHVSTD